MTGLQYRCTHRALTSTMTSGDEAETRQRRKTLTDSREQRQTPTVQQVLGKLLQNGFHARGGSAVQPIKQVLCQFAAAFVVSAVNSWNKRDETLFSGPNREQRERERDRGSRSHRGSRGFRRGWRPRRPGAEPGPGAGGSSCRKTHRAVGSVVMEEPGSSGATGPNVQMNHKSASLLKSGGNPSIPSTCLNAFNNDVRFQGIIKSRYPASVSSRFVDHPVFHHSLMWVFGFVSLRTFVERTVNARCCEV